LNLKKGDFLGPNLGQCSLKVGVSHDVEEEVIYLECL
jgi:hypothetical protein